MPADTEIGNVSEPHLRQACADLDRCLRAGEHCRAERFFSQTPLLASQEDWAIELIYTEFVAREELGQRPTPEEFCARFPHWQERLRRQLQLHELLRDTMPDEPPPSTEEPVPPAELPPRLGCYEVLEEIARGGSGMVCRAWQPGLQRFVALKALLPELGCQLAARRRFCEEARVLATLRHRHIMPVHDIGEHLGILYFTMDLASGSLAEHIPARDLPRAVAWLEKVARASHFAHQQGFLHCDLKPSNVLLDGHGEPLLSDFGLARRLAGEMRLEGAGRFSGTPVYMAPEQVSACEKELGPPADVWALGVILYELLSGKRPFLADNLADLQDAICSLEPKPIPAAPQELQAICWRCLAKEPAQRFPTAEALAEALGGGDWRGGY